MSEVKEIRVEYGETVNTGNFENIKVTVSMTKTLTEGESPKEEVQKSLAGLRSLLKSEVAKMKNEK